MRLSRGKEKSKSYQEGIRSQILLSCSYDSNIVGDGWTTLRWDATISRGLGVSGGLGMARVAMSQKKPVDLQQWGHALNQA